MCAFRISPERGSCTCGPLRSPSSTAASAPPSSARLPATSRDRLVGASLPTIAFLNPAASNAGCHSSIALYEVRHPLLRRVRVEVVHDLLHRLRQRRARILLLETIARDEAALPSASLIAAARSPSPLMREVADAVVAQARLIGVSGSLWKLYDITIVARRRRDPAAPTPPRCGWFAATRLRRGRLLNVSVDSTFTLSGNDDRALDPRPRCVERVARGDALRRRELRAAAA